MFLCRDDTIAIFVSTKVWSMQKLIVNPASDVDRLLQSTWTWSDMKISASTKYLDKMRCENMSACL